MQAVAANRRMRRRAASAFRRYVIILVVAAIGAIALWVGGSVMVTRTRFYVHTSPYAFDVIADQRFALSGAHHELLVVGDSSALIGVIPEDVTRQTGLDTYDLALYASAGIGSYDRVLENYMAHNAAPEIVVLYVTAMEPAFERQDGAYERTLILFRYGSLSDIATAIARDPGVTIWPAAMLRKTWRKRDWHGQYYDTLLAELTRNRGHMAMPKASLSDACAFDSRADISSKDALVAFRRKWAARIAHVAFYIAPMAACDRAYSYYVAEYRGIADNEIAQLPGHLMVDNAHPTPEGAHEASRLLAEFVGRWRQNWK